MKIAIDDWIEKGDVILLPHNTYTIDKVISAEYVMGAWEVEFIDDVGHHHDWRQFYDGGSLLQYHTERGVKVIRVAVEQLPNAGCNNGNYPNCKIYMDNGVVVHDVTCKCGRGCSGMARLPKVGQYFESMNGLYNYMNGWNESEE